MDARNAFSFAEELNRVDFGDKRLTVRLGLILDRKMEHSERAINGCSKNWSEAMATYRFFANEKVGAQNMLEGHRHSLLERAKLEKAIIVTQDTTSIKLSSHVGTEGLGPISNGFGGKGGKGFFVHTSEVLNASGTPLGILDQEVWARDPNKKGPNSRKNESERWQRNIAVAAQLQAELPSTEVYCVSDRESDTDINIKLGQELGVRVIVRAKAKSRSTDESETIVTALRREPAAQKTTIEVRDNKASRKRWDVSNLKPLRQQRFTRNADLEIRFAPIMTAKHLEAWVVLVDEPNPPKNVEPICWLLISAFPVNDLNDANIVIEVYRMRWQIELFHKILKSGCGIEDCRLDDFDKLSKFTTAISMVAWQIHALTYLARETPQASSDVILESWQWQALQATHGLKPTKIAPTLAEATLLIAKLAGYFGRKNDPPPGIQTMWRGWQRLADISVGFRVATELSRQDVYNR